MMKYHLAVWGILVTMVAFGVATGCSKSRSSKGEGDTESDSVDTSTHTDDAQGATDDFDSEGSEGRENSDDDTSTEEGGDDDSGEEDSGEDDSGDDIDSDSEGDSADADSDEVGDTESGTGIGEDTASGGNAGSDSDSGEDVDTDSSGDADTETVTEPVCDAGDVEWPAGSGECVPDPCIGHACNGAEECVLDESGDATCDCPDGWTGDNCDQLWKKISLPPFVLDVAFDAMGNGWFVTSLGLLYWDFNGTVDDTTDDSWQLYEHERLHQSIAIDDENRKWLAASVGETIDILDDNGTPTDTSDDNWQAYIGPFTPFESTYIQRFRLDKEGRIWLATEGSGGVKFLGNPSLLFEETVPWTTLFETETIYDAVAEDNGIWLVTDAGVSFVDLGGDIQNTGDDTRIDFFDVPALANQRVTDILIDADGVKWINTDAGILWLDDGGDPFNESGHSWTSWSPHIDTGKTGNGPLMAFGPDGEKWLKAPTGYAFRVKEVVPGTDRLMDYNPITSTLFQDVEMEHYVYAIAVDDANRKWLSDESGMYILDDNDTPMDTLDDLWVLAGRPVLNSSIRMLYPDAHGGAWVRAETFVHASGACDHGHYYYDMGDPRDRFDDVWKNYPDKNGVGGCLTLIGMDANGNQWFEWDDNFDDADGLLTVRNDSGSPLDETDDVIVDYAPSETGAFGAFDPLGGIWFGGDHLDTGPSLTDKTDDVWLNVGAFSTVCADVDAAGNRWFGHGVNINSVQDVQGDVRYLNDGGNLAESSGHQWTVFSMDDGMPFKFIADLQIDAYGLKWMRTEGMVSGTDEELCTLNDNLTPEDKSDDEWTVYSISEGETTPNILEMALDANDDLWLATSTGIRYLHLAR